MRGPVLWGAALAAAVGVIALTTAGADAQSRRGARSAAIDLTTTEGALAAARRIWCTETDGEPVYWYWQGEAYSRRQGERDKHLFNVIGINVRTCGPHTDPQRGTGFRSVSRELLIYVDKETGQPLAKWTNPWTSETHDVLHVANDPVNGDFLPKNRDGSPYRWNGKAIGGKWFLTSTAPLFYTNPLGGNYQAEVGGTYHATEMFNFMGDLANLTAAGTHTADVQIGWVRMSDWLPWMKMNGRDGLIYFHTAGRKTLRWEDVSQTMRDEIARHYPEYRNPPPVGDPRPNVTSWTYYRDVKEGKQKAPARGN
jgi:hypothetical protein